MGDDDAFARAVEESPADSTRRLVYADWLDERGDPRAEFLRVGVALGAAPPGDPGRRALGRRWAALRDAFDPGWVRRVGTANGVPAWASAAAGTPPRAGVTEFHEWMRGNHWEWVVVAVLAPIEAVARALIEARAGADPEAYRAAGRWLPGVPVRPPAGYDPVARLIPLVQLRGHAWTVATYDTFDLSMRSYLSAQADARAASARLGTVAVEFSSEDTSGATGYKLFECGDLSEEAEWEGDDAGAVRTKARPGPGWDRFPPDYPDELFRAYGLYVPGVYARADADGGCVVAGGVPPGEVERADLVALREAYREDDGGAADLRAVLPRYRIGPPAEWGDEVGDAAGGDDVPF